MRVQRFPLPGMQGPGDRLCDTCVGVAHAGPEGHPDVTVHPAALYVFDVWQYGSMATVAVCKACAMQLAIAILEFEVG